ncbi:MAG: hypothetical protein JNM77_08770 [Pseudonocardia sp.]|nr:hypothetical protein [Pseudonocardia sp.]
MANVHGKNVKVSLDGDDLSIYAKKVDFEQEADSHDVTTFGKNSKVYAGGLKDGTATIEGVYDNTASTGPAAAIRPLLGTVVELIYQPEGIGSGKPTHTVDVLVTGYKESAPVDDMVSWTADLQLSDDVATTSQGA